GQACAIRFAQEGAMVLVSDIDENGLKETEKKINNFGGLSDIYKLDVSNNKEVEDVIGKMLDKHKKIDVLINSAGCVKENSIGDVSKEEWLWQMSINLNGAFYLTKPVLKNMLKNKFGKIIYISSKSGIVAKPRRAAYSAAKFGLNGFTQALALEVAKEGITVNSICPSRILTKMLNQVLLDRAEKFNIPYEKVKEEHDQSVPIGRMGFPEDISGVAVFLASEDARYITGQFISVSGGR
ncbi:MAG: SDR family oxidoreductase, partial [Thermoplasmatales archaeon]|nr:SDR family oxidoreductase [Thermoplasmatales archaeon]